MPFLIDSNVLISSYDETEKQHRDSYWVVEMAMNWNIPDFEGLPEILTVTPKQVLEESG